MTKRRAVRSAARRAAIATAWTSERRQEARRRAAEQYESWRSEYPERALVADEVWLRVEAGELERPACDDCGRPMHPAYDWSAMARIGWRCRNGHDERMDADFEVWA